MMGFVRKQMLRSRVLPCVLCVLSVIWLTGCASGGTSQESADASADADIADAQVQESADADEGTADPEAERSEEPEAYLVTNVYGDGQKPWYLVLTYDAGIDPDSVGTDDFSVEDYEITAVYTNDSAELPQESVAGPYVLIELSVDYTNDGYTTDSGTGTGGGISGGKGLYDDSDDEIDSDDADDSDHGNASDDPGDVQILSADSGDASGSDKTDLGTDDREIRGGGRSGIQGSGTDEESLSNRLTVTWTQTGDLSATDGTVYAASDESHTTDYTQNDNLLVKNFTQDSFTAEDGTDLMYNLYLPDGYGTGTEYPLVLFMPDATGEGSDPYLTLTESLGGVIWTTEENQAENPCIVLAPQYEDDNTSDPGYTMELLNAVADSYSVDTNRIYLVGQSSGTIRSISMMIDYPDTFAGAMLVAGQADEAYEDLLSGLAGQNIWMICSAGDERAYPGMTAIMEAVESVGTQVASAGWSADLSLDEQNALAEEQQAQGTSILLTVYDAGTVMEDDVPVSTVTEHMNTWRVAYELDTVRSWLFAQTLE